MDPIFWYMLASSIISNITNIGLSERQRSYDESMVDKQNDYNTPANQVKRLEDAGINPSSLGMGQGLAISGNTSASPNGYNLPAIGDPMAMASNSLLSAMSAGKAKEEGITERDSREARIAEIKDRSDKYKAEVAMLGVDQKAQEIANEYAAQTYEVALARSWADIGLTEQNAKYLSTLNDKAVYELENTLPQELKLLVQQEKLNVLDQEKMVAAIKSYYQDIAESKSRASESQSHANLMDEQAKTEWIEQAGKVKANELLTKQVQMYYDTYEDVAKTIANEAKLSNRQVKAFWINTVLNGTKDVGVGAGGLGTAIKMAETIVK